MEDRSKSVSSLLFSFNGVVVNLILVLELIPDDSFIDGNSVS
jgi:hypothetical protein